MMWEQQGEERVYELRGRRATAPPEEGARPVEPAIPSQEMTSLLLVVGDAFTAGDCGEAARGYLLLRLGLERAVLLSTEDKPWAIALCAHWRRFLAEYELRYPEVRPAADASH